MSKKQHVVTELHKPARKNFKRRHVILKGVNDLWQIDLVEMNAYKKENNGMKYLLTIIDAFSKYAWAIPISNKSGELVTKAMESILLKGKTPKNIQSDDGKEFYNKAFCNLMQKYKINHYSTYSPLKASIVERFNRTLKSMMWKKFSLNGNYKWINIVQDLINTYNNTKHRTIKMKPIDVSKKNENQLLSTVYKYKRIIKRNKFKVGDNVRISKYKHIFEKGYTPNWTTEIFQIYHIKNTNPTTYLLKDFNSQPIKGGFYEYEISKVLFPDIYLVEKILKKNGKQLLVKWLGFKTPTWENERNML